MKWQITYGEWAYLIICCLIYSISYVYESYYSTMYILIYVYSSLPFFLYILYKVNQQEYQKKKFVYISIIIVLTSLLIGYVRTSQVIQKYDESSHFYEKVIGIYALEVVSFPELVEFDGQEKVKIRGKLFSLLPKEGMYRDPLPVHGDILVYIDKPSTEILKGDIIQVEGKASKIRPKEEYGNISIQSRYISKTIQMGIYNGTYVNTIVVEPHSFVDKIEHLMRSFWKYTHSIRNYVKKLLHDHLDPSIRELGSSLLLGASYGDLDEQIVDSFSKTGVIHIISISGSHISLIFSFIYGLLYVCKVKKDLAIYCSICIVLVYCTLVGWDPPVVRSALMGIIAAIGWIRGRLYNALQGLNCCTICMLIWNPLWLFDVSFQLSTGATYGILLWFSILYSVCPKGKPYIVAPLVLTISAELCIIPLQLYYFHMIGYGSLVASLLVTPLLDFGILCLLCFVILELIWLPAIAWHTLSFIIKFALFLTFGISKLPYSYIWFGIMPSYLAFLYLIGLGGFRYYINRQAGIEAQKGIYGLMITIGAIILGSALMIQFYPKTSLTAITSKGIVGFTITKKGIQSYSFLYLDLKGERLTPILQRKLLHILHGEGQSKWNYIEVDGVQEVNQKEVQTFIDVYQKSVTNVDPQIEVVKNYDGTFIKVIGRHSIYQFGNGQNLEKHIQLSYISKVVLGTTNEKYVGHLLQGTRPSNLSHIILWNPRTSRIDIDPEEEGLTIVGKERVLPMEI